MGKPLVQLGRQANVCFFFNNYLIELKYKIKALFKHMASPVIDGLGFKSRLD